MDENLIDKRVVRRDEKTIGCNPDQFTYNLILVDSLYSKRVDVLGLDMSSKGLVPLSLPIDHGYELTVKVHYSCNTGPKMCASCSQCVVNAHKKTSREECHIKKMGQII